LFIYGGSRAQWSIQQPARIQNRTHKQNIQTVHQSTQHSSNNNNTSNDDDDDDDNNNSNIIIIIIIIIVHNIGSC
jgi:Ca2+/H+ antiporter